MWHTAYDCDIGEEVLFRILPHNFPADNPQQSETCSHIGLKGNFWCRRCYVGGTEVERASAEGYKKYYKVHHSKLP